MAHQHAFDFDLIVIGSGAGGSIAATIVASAGKKVAIIESDTFGGESSNWSDIPIRAVLRSAHLYDDIRRSSKFGLRATTVGYNYHSIRNWKDLAVKRTGVNDNKTFYEKHGITAIKGLAHFIAPHEITVNRRHYSARNFLVATGSTWIIPDIPGLSDISYFTPRTILEEIRPPKTLAIIGSEGNALEIADFMSAFGTKVTIIDQASRLLPDYDIEAGQAITQSLAAKGIDILTSTRVLSVHKEPVGKRLIVNRGGEEKSLRAEEIMLAIGKVPNVDLGLENAAIAFTNKGVEVNQFFQTSNRQIYAVGDVIERTNSHSTTQTALLESRTVAHNLLHAAPVSADYTATSRTVVTNPEIAQVGLSEIDCRRRRIAVNKYSAPIGVIARSNTSDSSEGFVKIITNKRGIVIGGLVVSPLATELANELAIAIKNHLTIKQVADTPHAFLSWGEVIKVAASK